MCASHSKEKEKKGIIERPVQGERCSPKIIWPPSSLFSPRYNLFIKMFRFGYTPEENLKCSAGKLVVEVFSTIYSFQRILNIVFKDTIIWDQISTLTLKIKNRIHKECSNMYLHNLKHWCFCFIFSIQTKERGRGGAGSANKHRKNCECCPVSQLIVR